MAGLRGLAKISVASDADDVVPYLLGGRPFPPKLFFRATGISMFAKRNEAVELARGGRLGRFVAELRLEDEKQDVPRQEVVAALEAAVPA